MLRFCNNLDRASFIKRSTSVAARELEDRCGDADLLGQATNDVAMHDAADIANAGHTKRPYEVARMSVRTAADQDAAGMSRMLERLVAAGRRTARADVGIMREAYISHPSSMWCALTPDDNGKLLGFQSLILCDEWKSMRRPRSAGASLARMSIWTRQEVGVGRKRFQVTERPQSNGALEY